MARDAKGHRWSGWPGAYCMYCGGEDPKEICLADGHDLDCRKCKGYKCPIPDELKDAADRKFNPNGFPPEFPPTYL